MKDKTIKQNKQQRTAQDRQENKNKGYADEQERINQQMLSLFPKVPYKTQLQIANQLYQILQQNKHTDKRKNIRAVIVESPTGTGKTYSLLVGVLTWLIQNPNELQSNNNRSKQQQKRESSQNQQSTIPSWLIQKNKQYSLEKITSRKQQRLRKLKTIKEVKQSKNSINKNMKTNGNTQANKLEWQVQDIEDIQDTQNLHNKKLVGQNKNNKRVVDDILAQEDQLPKIIFVSRTHSQLSQVMTSINQIITNYQSKGVNAQLPKFRYINMASKDHLCVHSGIQKNRVHQKCQYLLSHGGCPYYHQQAITQFVSLRIDQAQKLGEQANLCAYFATKNLLPVSDIVCVPYASILSPQIRNRLNLSIRNSIIIFDQAHNIIEQQLSIKSPEISYGELEMLCNRIDEYKDKYGKKMLQQNTHLLNHMQDICRALMNIMKEQHSNKFKYGKQQEQSYQQVHDSYYDDRKKASGNEEKNKDSDYQKLTKMQLFTRMKLAEIQLHRIKNYISLSNFDQKLVHFTNSKPNVSLNNKNQDKFNSAVECHQFSMATVNNFLQFITALVNRDFKHKDRRANYSTGLHEQLNSTIVLIKNLTQKKTQHKSNIANAQRQKEKGYRDKNSTQPADLSQVSIKLFCMQSTQISQIIEQSRLCIMAGGTMEPISSFVSIFHRNSSHSPYHYKFIKGHHVIEDKQCNVFCIGGVKSEKQNKDKTQKCYQYKLMFTFKQMKQDCKQILQNSVKVIRKIISKLQTNSGAVVFVQSYAFLQLLQQYLGQSLDKIQIFYDTASKKQAGNIFEKYQSKIQKDKSCAILVSVMGGKLSQGINFSDQLARIIIVLGLPYPNLYAPEIVQKMKYLDDKFRIQLQEKINPRQTKQVDKNGQEKGIKQRTPLFESANKKFRQKMQKERKEQEQQEQTGRSYYENCCIKVINQTIGRGIRHIKDYADIYLVDFRFSGISHRLPTWMSRRVKFIDFYQC